MHPPPQNGLSLVHALGHLSFEEPSDKGLWREAAVEGVQSSAEPLFTFRSTHTRNVSRFFPQDSK